MSETLHYHDGKGYRSYSSIFDSMYFMLLYICESQGILNAFGTFLQANFEGAE